MSGPEPVPSRLDPPDAAGLLANLGFIASSDLPDRPGPSYLLVAFRPEPTLHHYDPEFVEYWVTVGGRGEQRALTRDTKLPVDSELSWGLLRIVDRLKASNEYLTFGGHLAAASIEGTTVAVFTSPAPLLRRGGHSQGWTMERSASAPSSAGSWWRSTTRPDSRFDSRKPVHSHAMRRSSATWSGATGQALPCDPVIPNCGRCSMRTSAVCNATTRSNGRRVSLSFKRLISSRR